MAIHGSTRRQQSLKIAACAAAAVLAHSAGAQCQIEWSDQFGFAGDAVAILDSTIWDDGTGPSLYAVGTFRSIGNSGSAPSVAPQFIARWDAATQRWRSVGVPYLPGHVVAGMNRINCISTFDADGPGGQPPVLVVGGRATVTAGGQCVAAWDGNNWYGLGSLLGTAPEIRSLAEYDADGAGPNPPELYAVGNFRTTTASTGANARLGIARWNGSSWSEVDGSVRKATGAAATAHRLAVYSGDLYVGGDFDRVGPSGSITAFGLAKWNGANWSSVPGVVSGNFTGQFLLKTLDIGQGPALLVSALKYSGQANPAGLAQYKDGAWSTLLESPAPPYTGQVFAAAMHGGSLYIGGRTLGPITPGDPLVTNNSQLFRLTPSGWENVGNMGRLTVAAGATTGSDRIDSASVINTLTPIDWDGDGPGGEKLFVAGQFAYADEKVIWNMLLVDDAQIEPILWGSAALGFNGTYNNNGTGAANSPTISFAKELDIDGTGPAAPMLVVGGQFASAGTKQLNGLVGFDGTQYQAIGNPGALVSDFAVRDAIYFNDASDPRLVICRPDAVLALDSVTNTWSSIDGAGDVQCFLQFPIAGQNRLIAFKAGGCESVAYLNGSTWDSLSAGIPVPGELGGCTARISDAVVWDDGTGPTMYAALYVPRPTAEVWSEAHLIRWDAATSQWSVWGDSTITNYSNVGEQTYANLAVHQGDLYVTGSFQSINNVPDTAIIARRSGATWVPVVGPFWPETGGVISRASNLAWHDFGFGPELVVRASFSDGSGLIAGAARWDGESWEVIPDFVIPGVGVYTGGNVYSVQSGQSYDGLYFTGTARLFPDNPDMALPSCGLARLNVSCSMCPACAADFDGNGGVDGGDLAAFFADFEAGENCADVDGNGGVDGGDLAYFFAVFEAGGC